MIVYRRAPAFKMVNASEQVAQRTMEQQGWCYYSSGADDEITLRENHAAYQRVMFLQIHF